MQYCGGGELYGLLMSQPSKRLSESHMRFYVAEILLALQYLHLLGFVYRCAASAPAQHLWCPLDFVYRCAAPAPAHHLWSPLGFFYRCGAPAPAQHLWRPFRGMPHLFTGRNTATSCSFQSHPRRNRGGSKRFVVRCWMGPAVIRQQVLMAWAGAGTSSRRTSCSAPAGTRC